MKKNEQQHLKKPKKTKVEIRRRERARYRPRAKASVLKRKKGSPKTKSYMFNFSAQLFGSTFTKYGRVRESVRVPPYIHAQINT